MGGKSWVFKVKEESKRFLLFIDVRMIDAIDEADAGTFVRILILKFHVHLP